MSSTRTGLEIPALSRAKSGPPRSPDIAPKKTPAATPGEFVLGTARTSLGMPLSHNIRPQESKTVSPFEPEAKSPAAPTLRKTRATITNNAHDRIKKDITSWPQSWESTPKEALDCIFEHLTLESTIHLSLIKKYSGMNILRVDPAVGTNIDIDSITLPFNRGYVVSNNTITYVDTSTKKIKPLLIDADNLDQFNAKISALEINIPKELSYDEQKSLSSITGHDPDTVIFLYKQGIPMMAKRVCELAGKNNYLTRKAFHLKDNRIPETRIPMDSKGKAKPLHVNGSTVYIYVCCGSDEAIHGKDLETALGTYHDHGANKVVLVFGRNDDFRKSFATRESTYQSDMDAWISNNKIHYQHFLKKKFVEITTIEECIKSDAYQQANEFFSNALCQDTTAQMNAENDISTYVTNKHRQLTKSLKKNTPAANQAVEVIAPAPTKPRISGIGPTSTTVKIMFEIAKEFAHNEQYNPNDAGQFFGSFFSTMIVNGSLDIPKSNTPADREANIKNSLEAHAANPEIKSTVSVQEIDHQNRVTSARVTSEVEVADISRPGTPKVPSLLNMDVVQYQTRIPDTDQRNLEKNRPMFNRSSSTSSLFGKERKSPELGTKLESITDSKKTGLLAFR